MITFRHAGDRGDIIASLPVVKYLCGTGQCIFYLEAATYTREMLTPENWRGLEKILQAQPYITTVLPWRGEKTHYNLNDFRAKLHKALRVGAGKNKSLADWFIETHNVPPDCKDAPWLTLEPNRVARVVFNRSGANRPRQHIYHNAAFPWPRVIQKYKGKSVFIGLPDEYEEFQSFFIEPNDVPFFPTRDLFEASRVIAGCDLFVGNQSVALWVAEGLKKDIVLEVWREGPNSNSERVGFTQGWDNKVVLPELK